MKSPHILFIVFLLLASCNKRNPIAVDELVLQSPADTARMFPYTAKLIPIVILSSNVSSVPPTESFISYDYFDIVGVGYSDELHTKLNVLAYARKVTPKPITVQYRIQIRDASHTVPITFEVQDFYLASSFTTNVTGDTIRIPRDGSFLLQITCKDLLGNPVSRNEIQRRVNQTWSIDPYFGYPKFTVSPVYRDTLSFYFMFTAFPDISPDADDLRYGFMFELSNKQFHMPIRINFEDGGLTCRSS